jgi:hypothetical protein
MSRVDKKIEKWLKNTPTDEPVDSVKAIIERFFSGQHSLSSGSHIVIQDDRLKGVQGYGPAGDFTVCVSKGKRVKGRYLYRLAHTIKLLEELKEIE